MRLREWADKRVLLERPSSSHPRSARCLTTALARYLGNFLHPLATLESINDWSLTSLKEKLITIRARVVSHGRYVAFQIAEVAIPRNLFAEILGCIAELQLPPAMSTA